jgi:hypothetical protein
MRRSDKIQKRNHIQKNTQRSREIQKFAILACFLEDNRALDMNSLDEKTGSFKSSWIFLSRSFFLLAKRRLLSKLDIHGSN